MFAKIKNKFNSAIACLAQDPPRNLITLDTQDISKLVMTVKFQRPLNFFEDGYLDAGVAIERMAYAIGEHYEEVQDKKPPHEKLIESMMDLAHDVAMQVYRHSDGRPLNVMQSMLENIVSQRNIINDMLKDRINGIIEFDSRQRQSTVDIAGFSRGLNEMARKYKIGPFAQPDFKDESEDMIKRFVLQKKSLILQERTAEPRTSQPQ